MSLASPLGFSKKHKPCATMSAASLSPCPGENLPDDLITEILVRLPVRYLVRFELVCKAWLYMITSPTFIKMHVNITADRESPKSFIVARGQVMFYRINWPDENDRDEDLVLPCKFSYKYFDSVVIGVANGIVCAFMNFCDKTIILWNPATHKSKKLPQPIINRCASTSSFSVGFGFDSKADDYKVVKLLMYKKYAFVKAEVYSANKICWKQVRVGINFRVRNITCDLCLDGMLYWLSIGTMVTYDLNTEEFNNQIELPKVEVAGRWVWKIVEFMDSFGLSVHRHGRATYCIEEISFWSLDDASGKGSWSKKFSFETRPKFSQMERIFLHLKNGSVVALRMRKSGSSYHQKLVLYDPKTKKVQVIGENRSPKVKGLYSYTESLVPIPGSE